MFCSPGQPEEKARPEEQEQCHAQDRETSLPDRISEAIELEGIESCDDYTQGRDADDGEHEDMDRVAQDRQGSREDLPFARAYYTAERGQSQEHQHVWPPPVGEIEVAGNSEIYHCQSHGGKVTEGRGTLVDGKQRIDDSGIGGGNRNKGWYAELIGASLDKVIACETGQR